MIAVSAGLKVLVATKPIDFRKGMLAAVSRKSTIAEAIRYGLNRWDGLIRFLDGGRIEIDSNVVERTIRPIALTRKNALFARSDGGGEHRAIVADAMHGQRCFGSETYGITFNVNVAASR